MKNFVQTTVPSGGSINQNNNLFNNLIPLKDGSCPSSPLLCIGQGLSVGQINIAGIFVSPAGQVTMVLSEQISEHQLQFLLSELRTWDSDRLDEIASDYTYRTQGQAFLIIDLMARHGYLNFSGTGKLAKSISQCMRDGSFNLFRIGETT